VAKLFPSAGPGDAFSDAQIQLAQEAEPLSIPQGFIGTVLRTLNRGSGSGVSGWTNAFILDVFTSDSETRESGKDLLTALCNKMLAGQMRSPLWLLSRLVLIPKPSDNPSAPITLRPLGLPEIFYRLAGRAAVRIEGPLVGPTMEPVQLGVGRSGPKGHSAPSTPARLYWRSILTTPSTRRSGRALSRASML